MAAINVPLFEGFISVDNVVYHGLRIGSHVIGGTQYIGYVYHNDVLYGVFATLWQQPHHQQQEAYPNAADQQLQLQPNNGMDINGNAQV